MFRVTKINESWRVCTSLPQQFIVPGKSGVYIVYFDNPLLSHLQSKQTFDPLTHGRFSDPYFKVLREGGQEFSGLGASR